MDGLVQERCYSSVLAQYFLYQPTDIFYNFIMSFSQ